jgi:hypothetical protein
LKEIFGERAFLSDSPLPEDFKMKKIIQTLSMENPFQFKFTTEMDETELDDSNMIMMEDFTPMTTHTSFEEIKEEIPVIEKKTVKYSVIDHYSLLDSKKEEANFRRPSG